MLVEVIVTRLVLDSASEAFVVILREKAGSRLLPIWIGKPEADSIALQLNQGVTARPNAHDVAKAFVTGLGGTLQRIVITRIVKSTYYAELQLNGANGPLLIDSRPSDGIAIALRLDAPIFADDALLSTVDEAESAPNVSSTSEVITQLSPEQLKHYLANLRPEDFGKFLP